jgi:hypothetical protein
MTHGCADARNCDRPCAAPDGAGAAASAAKMSLMVDDDDDDDGDVAVTLVLSSTSRFKVASSACRLHTRKLFGLG